MPPTVTPTPTAMKTESHWSSIGELDGIERRFAISAHTFISSGISRRQKEPVKPPKPSGTVSLFAFSMDKTGKQELKNKGAKTTKRSLRTLRSAARSKPRNGGLGQRQGAGMTSLFWNGSTFVPQNRQVAIREAVVLRLERALASPDASHSQEYHGAQYLRRNGFSSAS